jgi:hypothetical protein
MQLLELILLLMLHVKQSRKRLLLALQKLVITRQLQTPLTRLSVLRLLLMLTLLLTLSV